MELRCYRRGFSRSQWGTKTVEMSSCDGYVWVITRSGELEIGLSSEARWVSLRYWKVTGEGARANRFPKIRQSPIQRINV